MSNVAYPYRIHFPRTAQWHPNYAAYGDGDWMTICQWCNECIGKGKWDYYWSEFVFEREEDYMLFKLKWIL